MTPTFATFWRERATWPQIVPPGFVFLGQAVHDLGAAMFADDWTGDELLAELVQLPMVNRRYEIGELLRPVRANPVTDLHRTIKQRVDQYRREENTYRAWRSRAYAPITPLGSRGAADRQPVGPEPPKPAEIPDAEWEAWGVAEIERLNAVAGPKVARADKVLLTIAQEAAAGRLLTAAQPLRVQADTWCVMNGWGATAGGALRSIPGTRWLSPHWRTRFAACQINVRWQDEDAAELGPPEAWAPIFVDAASLRDVMAGLDAPALGEGPEFLAAYNDLRARCAQAGDDSMAYPKREEWCAEAVKTFGISGRAAERAWARVAEKNPLLSSRSKPRERRGR